MTLPQRPLKDKDGTQFAPIVERFIGAVDGKIYSLNTLYTAEEDGWVLVDATVDMNKWIILHVDGKRIFAVCNTTVTFVFSFTAPVKKGQSFYCQADSGAGSCVFFKTA